MDSDEIFESIKIIIIILFFISVVVKIVSKRTISPKDMKVVKILF